MRARCRRSPQARGARNTGRCENHPSEGDRRIYTAARRQSSSKHGSSCDRCSSTVLERVIWPACTAGDNTRRGSTSWGRTDLRLRIALLLLRVMVMGALLLGHSIRRRPGAAPSAAPSSPLPSPSRSVRRAPRRAARPRRSRPARARTARARRRRPSTAACRCARTRRTRTRQTRQISRPTRGSRCPTR